MKKFFVLVMFFVLSFSCDDEITKEYNYYDYGYMSFEVDIPEQESIFEVTNTMQRLDLPVYLFRPVDETDHASVYFLFLGIESELGVGRDISGFFSYDWFFGNVTFPCGLTEVILTPGVQSVSIKVSARSIYSGDVITMTYMVIPGDNTYLDEGDDGIRQVTFLSNVP